VKFKKNLFKSKLFIFNTLEVVEESLFVGLLRLPTDFFPRSNKPGSISLPIYSKIQTKFLKIQNFQFNY